MIDPYHSTAWRMSIPILTDASGDFTKTTGCVTGKFVQIRYQPATSNSLDSGWDLDVVGATTGTVLLNIDDIGASAVQRSIGQILYDVTGDAETYDGTNEIYIPGIWISNEALTITVADGGNAQSGTLHLIFSPS
jgi:hypothetical protein